MATAKKSHKVLKIVLICVLAVIIIVGGSIGIWALHGYLNPTTGVDEPDSLQSTRKELGEGETYSSLSASGDVTGLDNLAYMAWVLDSQTAYHAEATNTSESGIYTQYTKTYKDYEVIDGVRYLVISDLTYSSSSIININSGTQSLFVLDGEGAGVYMRTADEEIDEDSVYTDVNWSTDTPVYYDDSVRADEEAGGYYYVYGAYSTEMTVYILNDETVDDWSDVTDNGDGTYTQTYTLKSSAAYLYQYKMYTHGGLDSLPDFESITMTVTFDDNYRVLEIVTEETTDIRKGFPMTTSATTTTTFSYDEEDVNEEHFESAYSFFEPYVGTLTHTGGTVTTVDYTDVLLSVLGSALTSEGQQFDVTLNVGDNALLYGRLYVSVDISNGFSVDAMDIRLAISADEDIDSQDLYIELSEGTVNCYYSTDFALTANIDEVTDIINEFSDFINNFEIGATEGDSTEEVLAALLNETEDGETDEEGLTLAGSYEDGVLTVTLTYSGISLDLVANVTEDSGSYTLVNAQLGVGYNGEDLGISLGLAPSSADTISHEASETPFNLAEGIDSLLELLRSESIEVEITLQGKKLTQLLSALGVDLDVSDLVLEINGNVDPDGLTVAADVTLTSADGETTYLDADVYYIYNGSSPKYGTAYVNIATLLGEELNLKVSCEIDSLVEAVSNVLAAVQGSGAVTLDDTQDGISSVISAVFSLDFGNLISDLEANDSVIGATLNLDDLFAQLGVNISLGDIVLSYRIGEDGVGSLHASVEDLLTVNVGGSDTIIVVGGDTAEDDGTVADTETTEGDGTVADTETTEGEATTVVIDTTGYVDISFVADFVADIFAEDESGEEGGEETETTNSLLYTFYQEELSLNLNASMGLTLKTSIVIEDLYITVGVDEDGEFLLSLTGELQNSILDGYDNLEDPSGYYTSSERTIGFTYYNGYITLMNQVEGEDAEYRVMTADYLLDNLLTYDLATYSFENVLSWYLGMGDSLKMLLALFGGFLPTVSSGALEAEDVYMYDTSSGDTSESSVLDYLLGYILTDGTNTISSTDMSGVLKNLGLTESTDSYIALSINAGAITSILDALDVAIVGNSETGEGSIKAYVSVYEVISTLLDLSFTNEYTSPNYYKYAVETYGIDFNHNFDVELETGHVAVFGEYSSETGYGYTETLDEYTLSVYSGEELISTQTVQYGATVYLYDTIDGVEYIYVCYDEDGEVLTDEDGLPVTSVEVSGDLSVYLVPAADYDIVFEVEDDAEVAA